MNWCFKDEADAYSVAVLEHLGTATAIVPTIWSYEVVNVLRIGEKLGRLCGDESGEFLEYLRQFSIVAAELPPRLDQLLVVARRYGLTSYDAAYLDLAIREGVPIATRDSGLRAAAREARVDLLAAEAAA